MVRTLIITALATAGFALPAMADTSSSSAAKAAALSTALNNAEQGEQIRYQLMHNGFTHVSALMRMNPAEWAGTATKDGKTVVVAVRFPEQQKTEPAID
jgi:hypothetical protein